MVKKILCLCFLVLSSLFVRSQKADTLIRSTGFFISPACSNLNNADDSVTTSPRFGLSAGYRFVNKFKYGFFIESGLNYTWIGAKYPKTTQTVLAFGRNRTFSIDKVANQMFLSIPFLAGYKTQSGKVRFQASLGFSFDLMFSNYAMEKISGDYPYGIDGKSKIGDVFTIGGGFSGIVKAGISIPATKRLSIDILPSLRYHFISFNQGSSDLIQSATTDFQKWSAGIDIGLMWTLDNNKPETFEEKRVVKPQDYTFQYNPDEPQIATKKNVKPWGYKNYLYLEIAGTGLVYSINYERNVFEKGIVSLNARAGYGFTARSYAFPMGMNVLLGRGTKKFEAGVYATFENYLLNEFNINITPAMAFRWISREHFFLRLSVMSHIVIGTGEIVPGVGLSMGGGF